MHFVLALGLSAMAQAPAPVESVSTFPPRTAYEERKALHVPEGFEVQLVAAEPAIQKPMNIAFDDRGRLWVTGSVEYPYPAKDGVRARDTVKVLEDFGPDGRAGKITTFAGGLNIPIGLLPLPGGDRALVYSIPNTDLLRDADGDGRAELREPFYRQYGHRDTHGMTGSFHWGIDGWVYACHGFANDSTVEGTDRAPITMNSGNVYRMRPDGSHAEFFTHGQVNPFGLSFDPMGNLYSSDCHTRPIYLLLRGAYYPSFGKPDDGLGFGPEMMSHDHGSTAIDGATYYAADHFPAPYRDTLFIGNVVTNRINHDRLQWRGSSPWAVPQPDFLWSEDNWFRPVDIELGPDGALYVADFYNRIIGHYEVPLTHPGRDHDHGRIWRIVYRGPDGKGRPAAPRADWSKATVDELIEDLGHANLAVRTRAANQLAARDDRRLDERLATLAASEGNTWRRVHSLWVLHRRDRLEEPALLGAAADPARDLRVHAMRVIAERTALGDAFTALTREALKDVDPLVRRTAAEALGRHPGIANVRPLLDLRQSSPTGDTHLIHTVRMALRDQLRTPSAWDQLSGLPLSERDARDIADVATGVPSAQSASYLLRHVERVAESPETVVRFLHHVARYGDADQGGRLVSYLRGRSGDGPARLAGLVKAVLRGTQERGAKVDSDVRGIAAEVSRSLLDSAKVDEVLLGIDLARSFRLDEIRPRLETFAMDSKAGESARIEAVSALVAMNPEKTLGLLGRLLADSSAPVPLRERAASSLSGINEAGARQELLRVLPTAPGPIQTAIAVGLAARKPGTEALLDAIATGKASARLLQDPRVARPLANSNIEGVGTRIATLLKGLAPADERLRELLKRRRETFGSARRDPAQGAKVFAKICANCHQLGGKGERIGPQLDGVGVRGLDRLLEDVLDPSRNVDQAFRLTNLGLANGQQVSGLLLKEEGAVLVLADSQGKELRVPRETVEERSTSQLSPMPANLSDQISEPDFHDLLAYLLLQQDRPVVRTSH